MMRYLIATTVFALGCFALTIGEIVAAAEPAPIRVLIVDGQNNHKWEETTPVIKQTLESSGRFTVDVATSPAKGQDMSAFEPAFSDYDVVVSNYNGDRWSEGTRRSFEKYVAGGNGFVSVHAADNSFRDWDAYNRMIGLGGWGGRNEKDGPYVRWKEDVGQFVRDRSPGKGGAHGKRVPFAVVVRDREHPITKGLPGSFMQTADELYAKLRGPAENMHVLATGFSAPATGGTGEHEPLLMSIRFGEGRVFHTTLGHDVNAMKGLAFQVTLLRGTEWAATGAVTFPDVDAATLSADEATINDVMLIAAASPAATDVMPDVNADNWTPMIVSDGLSGWSQKNGTATFRFDDGVVIGKTADGSPNSFLCTVKTYQDFELTFEVMVDAGLNSGVQIRSQSKPDFKNGRVHGPQVEIETAPGEAGYIYSEGTGRAWISTERPVDNAFKNGDWNRYVVRASGDSIRTWINGVAVADVTDAESNQAGFIGLQVHSIKKDSGPFEVRWRDLRIREL